MQPREEPVIEIFCPFERLFVTKVDVDDILPCGTPFTKNWYWLLPLPVKVTDWPAQMILSASDEVKTTFGIGFTWIDTTGLAVEHPFEPVPIICVEFNPTGKFGLNDGETCGAPWGTPLTSNSYVAQFALDNVMEPTKQIVLSGSFEKSGTFGKFKTVKVIMSETEQVLDSPITLTDCPLPIVLELKVLTGELGPCETLFTKNS